MSHKPKIAVSSCLLGHEVRFDGGHKNNRYLSDTLSNYFEFVPFCPEVAIGLGIPRPTIRLVRSASDKVNAVSNQDPSLVYTDDLERYADEVLPKLTEVSGYIFKKDSPSCGMERVRVYPEAGEMPVRDGSGIYASKIMQACPDLPIEEEGRLMDPRLRENFLERVFLYERWQQFVKAGMTSQGLVKFHTVNKFAVLAHDEPGYRELGRVVAKAGEGDLKKRCDDYISLLMRTMKVLATPGKHANVLMHIMGFLKDSLTTEDKAELLAQIDAHRNGLVPLIVPITLINYFRKRHPVEYIDGQTYLEPHPPELMLRNML